MRLSSLLAPTLRETPGEAEIASHQLMLRAGLMRKVAAGVYTYLPMGHRVISKVERIIREEMDATGAQELRLPILQPAELWAETGRWAAYGDEMWRVRDRHGRQFCLGPTHEEIITDLVRNEIRSYRQIPINLYQIQNKYRDEIRPRFGVMRGREFIMKDAYSFHPDVKSLEETYRAMYDAYTRIFKRCGLDFRAVEADSGAIGGSFTHEFLALADTGEASLVYCDGCGYAANVEKAGTAPPEGKGPGQAGEVQVEKVATPGVTSIEDLTDFLQVGSESICKTLFLRLIGQGDEESLVAVLLRGDHELNDVKLKNLTGALDVQMAPAPLVEDWLGVPLGYAGPVGLPHSKVKVIADQYVMESYSLITGANEAGYHLKGVVPGRDFKPNTVSDLRLVSGGDPCPRCREALKERRGIEVGQVFQLGSKYSEAMQATYLNEQGIESFLLMGCYGIGVTRTVAAIIEQNNDEDGIIWPVSVAPYHVVVIPVNWSDQSQRSAAEDLYMQLRNAGVEVCLDDRDERAGVKFKDADLMGFPFRVVIGPKGLASGGVEIVERSTRAAEMVPINEVKRSVVERLDRANKAR